jgi:NADPH:quinone reductase-like Zn-dependent oxidoreductase
MEDRMTSNHRTEPAAPTDSAVPAVPAGSTGTVIVTEVVLPGVVPPSGLQIRRRELPAPAAGQALVEVEATGVSYAEQSMRRNRYPAQPRFPFVLGYDLVGTVASVGPGVDASLVGTRVAAVTKTGGWASHVLVSPLDLVPVPAGLDPAAAETVVVNGITAWQLLHRSARVRPGQTILVHGANGGVGTTLVQLARHHGVRVIGTAAPRHHDALRALGVEPIDYNAAGLADRVRRLAPAGVDAVFDPIGGESVRTSYHLLARGGALVAYGNAYAKDNSQSMILIFCRLLARLFVWNALPNTHRALFYNFWAGHLLRRAAFRRRLRQDLTTVFDLLASGVLSPQIAARFPLTEAAAAMELAESRTVRGKVILEPARGA